MLDDSPPESAVLFNLVPLDVPEGLAASSDAIERLVATHRDFLGFLARRVANRETADEILQAAFVRTLEKVTDIKEPEAVVAWFYRLLRNALVDHHRRSAAESRAVARHEQESPTSTDPELRQAVCSCLYGLLPNLKPEYAEILRKVDLEEHPLPDAARDLGITANNAAVRLHRARQALKRELVRSCGTCATHGCLDCTCSASGCH